MCNSYNEMCFRNVVMMKSLGSGHISGINGVGRGLGSGLVT